MVNNNAPFPIRLNDKTVINAHIVLYPEVLTCWPLTWADWETCEGTFVQFKSPYRDGNPDIRVLDRYVAVEETNSIKFAKGIR